MVFVLQVEKERFILSLINSVSMLHARQAIVIAGTSKLSAVSFVEGYKLTRVHVVHKMLCMLIWICFKMQLQSKLFQLHGFARLDIAAALLPASFGYDDVSYRTL